MRWRDLGDMLTGASGKRYGRWGAAKAAASPGGGLLRGGAGRRGRARQSVAPNFSSAAPAAFAAPTRPPAGDLDADDGDLQRSGRTGLHELVWRYRRELTPLLVAVVLIGVAQWGHTDHPAGWLWALAIGPGATAVWWRWDALRPPVLPYVLAVGALATLWLTVAWGFGPVHRGLLLALLLGTLLAAVPWWDHQLPRPGMVAGNGDGSPELRAKVAGLVQRWPELAAVQGLAGVRLQPPVLIDEHGWQWHLRLPTLSRLTGQDVVAAAPRLDKAFRVRPGATRLELDPERADRLLLRVNVTNPLDKPIPYELPVEARSIADPIRLGLFEDRAVVEIELPGSHLLVVGRTGSGKTTFEVVLLMELLSCPDVVVWVCDVTKHGARYKRLEPGLGWLATEAGHARAMFAALAEIRDERSRWRAETGTEVWPTSPEHPHLILLVDEFPALMALGDFDQRAAHIAATGREDGISLIATGQRATAKELGGSVFVRTQCELRVGMAMDAPDVDYALDRGAHAAGYRPELFADRGMFYLRTPDYRVPRPARAYLMGDEQPSEVVTRWAPFRTQLEDPAIEIVARYQQGKPGDGRAAAPPATAAEARLRQLLDEVPPAGYSLKELVAAMRGLAARTWVMDTLEEWRERGEAVKLARGRWTGPGKVAA